MKAPKLRITFKIVLGYLLLGAFALYFGFLILSEIEKFTKLQSTESAEQNNILKVSNLIAAIYENENLSRSAIQLNPNKRFKGYLKNNDELLTRLDSFSFSKNTEYQQNITDSIKIFLIKKRKNIIDLRSVKRSYNSANSINNVINKLDTVNTLLGKNTKNNLVKIPNITDVEVRLRLQKYADIINGNVKNDSITENDQAKIDSLIFVSKNLLEKWQTKAFNQRISLLKREKELIENDITVSRKLNELLSVLENDVEVYTNLLNLERKKTLAESKKILLFTAFVGFLIIIVFSILFINDFWKNKLYRKKLEKANETTSSLLKSREQLISMVSHDLRTPLSTITGYSGLLQQAEFNNKEKNYIEHINNASNYMNRLVNDLTEFSKLENGEIPIESIPFDIEKTIREIVENSKSLIQEKPVVFRINHDNIFNFSIVSDPFRLNQILYNLIANACKFTDEGFITVSTKLKDSESQPILQISVQDTGIGIAKNQQHKIFNEFTQVNEHKTAEGFGLGLAIAKKLTTLLNGTLALQSEPNKGSTFVLEIPVKLRNKKQNSIKPKIETELALEILIVEDDVSLREFLKNTFNQFGIVTHIYSDAKIALNSLEKINYHLVLTDIQLPKMNGIKFMETLKTKSSYNYQPIIAMTGRANLSKQDYLNIGFSDVLLKPFQIEVLKKTIARFFVLNEINDDSFPLEKKAKTTNLFSLDSLITFYNNDEKEIKQSILIFTNETKRNLLLLKKAFKEKNTVCIKETSHKMLGMFKQLKIVTVIPFLVDFEKGDNIKITNFKKFEMTLNKVLESLESFID